jgi:hypothetical protein
MASTWIAAILIAIAGFTSVETIGESGSGFAGPQSFNVTVIHMIAFFFLGRHWPAVSRKLYWGGLIAALVLSVISLRLTYGESRVWRVLLRVLLGLVYAGFLVVLFKRP